MSVSVDHDQRPRAQARRLTLAESDLLTGHFPSAAVSADVPGLDMQDEERVLKLVRHFHPPIASGRKLSVELV